MEEWEHAMEEGEEEEYVDVERPVMYLDIDGVLWSVENGEEGPAIGLGAFLHLALEFFEIRWCTAWATKGHLDIDQMMRLESMTGVPLEAWVEVQNSQPWRENKYEAINVAEHLNEDGRLFVWVEDDLLPAELTWLHENNWADRYFYTDVFEDRNALLLTTARLIKWLVDNYEYEGYQYDE